MIKFDIEQFAEDIICKRILLSASRREVVEQSGINPNSIRDIEQGVSKNPTINTVVQMCEWLGKDVTEYIK